jgi:hypothetical protein
LGEKDKRWRDPVKYEEENVRTRKDTNKVILSYVDEPQPSPQRPPEDIAALKIHE